MNKFITFALIALCATVAQGQIISPYNIYSDLVAQNGGSSGSAASSASSSASTSAANQAINSRLISPLAPYSGVQIGNPWVQSAWPAPIAAPLAAAPLAPWPASIGAWPASVGAWPASVGAVAPYGQISPVLC